MASWDNETPPKDTRLLPEGWRAFKVISGDANPSKKGNPMFTVQLKDEQTGIVAPVYLMRTPGKRWNLKLVLEAIGVEKQDDDNYDYLPEIIGQRLMGEVVHEPNEYMNRQGEMVSTMQHRINSFKAYSSNPDGVSYVNDVGFEE